MDLYYNKENEFISSINEDSITIVTHLDTISTASQLAIK